MNVQFVLTAAKTTAAKGEKELAAGLANAANTLRLAAKKYREAADLDQANRDEYIKLAEDCEAKAALGAAPAPAAPAAPKGPAPKGPTPPAASNHQTDKEKENKTTAAVTEEEVSIDEALGRLNSLTGLQGVKQKVQSWLSQIRVFKLREARGLPMPDGFSYHLVFTGNPGTGKTTVARFMAQIYKGLGILEKGQLVEASSSDLIAGYVGQTATKTRELVETALGGVLFIDEAYTLNGSEKGNEFGQQAIDELLKCMEDHRRELVVIVAGYTDLMEKFLETNPGLKSRFNTVIEFDDYNGDELYQIFEGLCKKNQYVLTPLAKSMITEHFNKLFEMRDKNFGNGRTVRNVFQQVVLNQSQRIDKMLQVKAADQISDSEISGITEEDLVGVVGDENIQKTIEYERTKAEMNDGVIFGYLAQKNFVAATTALCSRLESLLKHVYNFTGELYEMINQLRSSGNEKAANLSRNDYDLIYRIRTFRNAHIHASQTDVVITEEDIVRCLKVISILE